MIKFDKSENQEHHLRQPTGQVEEPISTAERMKLVERIAASEGLRKASRLREFLLYVCSQVLERGASVIHEQEIGEVVFGRPRSYDTNVDNIVRVNATSLRKRLEHYFATEGATEEMILEIPRGSYIPTFRLRTPYALPEELSAGTTSQPLKATSTVAPATPQRTGVASRLGWPLVTSGLLLICTWLLWQNHLQDRQIERWKTEPSLRAFWEDFFASGRETDIVLADTSFSEAEDIMQRTISLNDYLNYNYKRFAQAPLFSDDQRRDLSIVLDRNNGSVGDFRVSQQIQALSADSSHMRLKFAREYTTDEAKHNNLILVGSQASNPWVGLFADKLNFVLQYDFVHRRPFITNRSPQPVEQAIYSVPDRSSPNNVDPPSNGYGVIAYLPDLSGKGKTLILEGTDSQATAATGEFITSDDSMAAFESKLPPGPISSFEILLRTSQLSGTPLHAEIVAFRIYSSQQK